MKILVTGSSGRIGRAIISRLLRHHDVLGYDQSPASVTQIVADLNHESRLMEAMRGVDAVIHTAALHAPHVPYLSEETFERVNVLGTQSVLRCCLANRVRTLVFTSTTALYGPAGTPIDRAGWVTEETIPVPRTVYHSTKLKAESLLRVAAENSTLRVTVLRISRCFPEPAPLMATYRLHRGIDARDVASAHELALLSTEEAFRTFIISGDTPFCQDDVYELKADASAVIQRRVPELAQDFARRGWPLPESIDRVYLSAAARAQLGWRPRYSYNEILREFDEVSSEVLPPARNWEAQE